MIMTPSPSVAGRTVVEDLGLVRGNTIRARHVGRDLMAALKSIVGGEIHDYTKMMAEAREQSLDRMRDQARELGADDCLMLNDAGFVTEASNSNVFFVIDDEIVTPAATVGHLRGLTKTAVHEACRERDVVTAERDISAEELSGATECFITSATREVMPVISLRLRNDAEVRFPAGGGPQTRRVTTCYEEHLQNYLTEHTDLSLF